METRIGVLNGATFAGAIAAVLARPAFLGLLSFFSLLAIWPRSLQAQPLRSAPVRSEYTTARLLIDESRIAPGESFFIGLELKTDPEWHTYWKNPGDSGLATSLHWQLPPGFTAGPILWPTPRRIFVEPLMSYGYGSDDPAVPGRVVLLTRIHVAPDVRPGPVGLAAAVEWLECKEICLPGEGRLRLNARVVPRGDSVAGEYAKQGVSGALAQLPRGLMNAAALPALQTRAELRSDHLLLTIEGVDHSGLAAMAAGKQMYFFIEDEGVVAHAEVQTIERSTDRLQIRVPRDLAANQVPTGEVRGVLKFLPEATAGSDSAVDSQAASGTSSRSTVDEAWYIRAPLVDGSWFEAAGKLLGMFVFAFLGGVLLNLMPCVLPVLSLKVLALVQSTADGSRNRERLIVG
ncbi:MAG: protein-disulfide reductase DsbD family protein, partial [Leptospirales bacterium]